MEATNGLRQRTGFVVPPFETASRGEVSEEPTARPLLLAGLAIFLFCSVPSTRPVNMPRRKNGPILCTF